jgi:hypothetical protein
MPQPSTNGARLARVVGDRAPRHSLVVRDATSRCPRCLDLEEEIRTLQLRLAASGHYVTYSPGPNSNPNIDDELKRFLVTSPKADAASGFRAGWSRLARSVGPKLREWEDRWLRARRVQDRLKSRIGVLLMELERLRDSR